MTREKEFVPVRDIAHYLIKTNHELKRINSQNATTPKELEALSIKVWKCHEAADLRMKQLDAEKEHIKTTLKRTWDLFAETIAPAMKIDDELRCWEISNVEVV